MFGAGAHRFRAEHIRLFRALQRRYTLRIYRLARREDELVGPFVRRRNRTVALALHRVGAQKWDHLLVQASFTWAGHIARARSWPWIFLVWRGEQWRIERRASNSGALRMSLGLGQYQFWRWESQLVCCMREFAFDRPWWELAPDREERQAFQTDWITWRLCGI